MNATDWNIYATGAGSWYAWNGRERRRMDLYPVPQGGTWRDSLHQRTQGPCGVNSFSVAVEQFERLIGPYYPSRTRRALFSEYAVGSPDRGGTHE